MRTMSNEWIDLSIWTAEMGFSAILGILCVLLTIGKLLHHTFSKGGYLCGYLVIPPAFISGVLGLMILVYLRTTLQENSNDFLREVINGLEIIKYNLINFVFSALTLGITCSRKSSHHVMNVKSYLSSIFHEALPMVIYSQILLWGQSMSCIAVVMVLRSIGFKFTNSIASLVPLGIEAGNDVFTSGIGGKDPYSSSIISESESLGLLFVVILSTYFLSNRSTSCLGNLPEAFQFKQSNGIAEAFERSNQPHNSIPRSQSESTLVEDYDVYDHSPPKDKGSERFASLGTHLSIVSLTVFASFGVVFGIRCLEIYFLQSARVFSGVRMFKLSMAFALISMVVLLRNTRLSFQREWFMRLCGLCLDLLVIAALARALPGLHDLSSANFFQCSFFVLVCIAWNIFCFKAIAPEIFPNFCIERSLTLSADALGHSFMGLALARALDPNMMSPVPAAYAFKLMLFFIPSSRGKNIIVSTILDGHGIILTLLVCMCIVACWFAIYKMYLKNKYISAASWNVLPKKGSDDESEHLRTGFANGNYSDSYELFGKEKSLIRRDSHHNLSVNNQMEMSPSRKQHEKSIDAQSILEESSQHTHSHHSSDPSGLSFENASISNFYPVSLSERSNILCKNTINSAPFESIIMSWMPNVFSTNLHWRLAYSLQRDGASLRTLLNQCSLSDSNSTHFQSRQVSTGSCVSPISSISPIVIIIEDSWGYVFGGCIMHPMQNCSKYYGTGESFVFSLVPNIAVYKWTRENDFFILSSNHSLAMGGGGSHCGFAFQLDEELDTGVSNHTTTFNNPMLASNEYFKTLNVEVWSAECLLAI